MSVQANALLFMKLLQISAVYYIRPSNSWKSRSEGRSSESGAFWIVFFGNLFCVALTHFYSVSVLRLLSSL